MTTQGLTVNGYLNILKTHFETVFKTELKLLKSVSIHRGRFTKDELKRVSVNAPSAHIALTGLELLTPHAQGFSDYRMSVAVTIITKDAENKPREIMAQDIIDQMAARLPLTEFGFTEPIMNIRGQNLYSGEVDKKGVMLWSLTFTQVVRIGKHNIGSTPATLAGDVKTATKDYGNAASYTKLQIKGKKA